MTTSRWLPASSRAEGDFGALSPERLIEVPGLPVIWPATEHRSEHHIVEWC
jgi:hypothetical protein